MYDSEIDIIESFQMVSIDSICSIPQGTKEIDTILSSILQKGAWSNWIDSSGKADPPPDFYNEKLEMMMEVMKVDDHGFISNRGKTINPTRQRETEVIRELQGRGVLDKFPNTKLFLNVTSALPTKQDHNYRYYRDNFVGVVEKHIKKIENYKENHPGYKVIFFVFDESSVYFEVSKQTHEIRMGEEFEGYPHCWYLDKAFIDSFKDSDVDYLIWFTPYKHSTACSIYDGSVLNLPLAVIFDVKNMNITCLEYNADLMESEEI